MIDSWFTCFSSILCLVLSSSTSLSFPFKFTNPGCQMLVSFSFLRLLTARSLFPFHHHCLAIPVLPVLYLLSSTILFQDLFLFWFPFPLLSYKLIPFLYFPFWFSIQSHSYSARQDIALPSSDCLFKMKLTWSFGHNLHLLLSLFYRSVAKCFALLLASFSISCLTIKFQILLCYNS